MNFKLLNLRIFQVVLILCFFTVNSAIASEFDMANADKEVIGLTYILERSIERNLELIIKDLDTDTAKWDFIEEFSNALPDIKLTATKQDLDGTFFLNPQFQGNIDTTQANFTLGISYRAFNGGQTTFAIMADNYFRKAAKEDYRRQYNQVVFDSIKLFNNLIQNQSALISKSKTVDEATLNLKLAEDKLEVGEGTLYEVLLAKSRLAITKQDLMDQKARLRVVQIDLARHLNLPLDSPLFADKDRLNNFHIINDDLSPENLIEISYENNPEIKMALDQKKAILRQELASYGRFLPALDLYANIAANGTEFDDLNQLNTIGFQLSYEFGENSGLSSVSSIRKAKIETKKAKIRLEDTTKEIEARLRRSYVEYKRTEANIDTAKASLDAANEALKLSKLRYENGREILKDLIDNESKQSIAEISLIDSIALHNIAQANLAFDLGNFSVENIVGTNFKESH
ncbi:MAG: TolC family protein [Candidatus Caenarcaniphilales bacterium]|nr:TolC family protein [Candidatus Caenarcaniphilales bacterium]